jgi:hypothetical protein
MAFLAWRLSASSGFPRTPPGVFDVNCFGGLITWGIYAAEVRFDILAQIER